MELLFWKRRGCPFKQANLILKVVGQLWKYVIFPRIYYVEHLEEQKGKI